MADPVDTPKGARAYLQELYRDSDPQLEGGPKFYVPDPVRVALNTILVDLEDLEDEVISTRVRLDLLRAHLVKYGEHQQATCVKRPADACSCGLFEALHD